MDEIFLQIWDGELKSSCFFWVCVTVEGVREYKRLQCLYAYNVSKERQDQMLRYYKFQIRAAIFLYSFYIIRPHYSSVACIPSSFVLIEQSLHMISIKSLFQMETSCVMSSTKTLSVHITECIDYRCASQYVRKLCFKAVTSKALVTHSKIHTKR